ncbi:hypothetical protein T484DRAFT_1856147 [Baffinella frigidus]|nr:hypothetical protein T484DRAFT_1856147 [Cryptophyta sp. CCMP2293]
MPPASLAPFLLLSMACASLGVPIAAPADGTPVSSWIHSSGPFTVEYPTAYQPPPTYTARALVPVPGYDAGRATLATIDISASISSVWKYAGGVLDPTGNVVFVPHSADNVGVFDPATRLFSVVDLPLSDANSTVGKYMGGVLVPSGKIIFVPHGANDVGVFDPATRLFSTVDVSSSLPPPLACKFVGGVLAPSGVVVFVPYYEAKVGIFNPATNAFSLIDIS